LIELAAISPPPAERAAALPFMAPFANTRIIQTPDVFMQIAGDHSIEPFFFISPRIALICNVDILDPLPVNESPASLLGRLYEKHGDNFARSLHGWFGIIIYDFEQRQLKAWTDHFGVRRLVFRASADSLAVASDLRILAGFSGSSPEIDPVAILEYLQYSCIPAPRTIYKGIRRLEPGHWLASRQGGTTRAYWGMKYQEISGRSISSWAQETYKAIESAVALAAKPVGDPHQLGCFLSGGTDSSSVSGLVGRITGKPPRTFSIGFADPRYNEIEYAQIAARSFKADHHEYFVKPKDILDLLQKVGPVFDEPFGNSSIIPAYYCARLAADCGVTHLLGGDGGDELFGGNQWYADDRIFQRYAEIPRLLRRCLIEPGLKLVPYRDHLPFFSRAANYVLRAAIPAPDRWHSYDFLSITPGPQVFSREFLASLDGMDRLEASHRHFTNAPTHDDLNRMLYLDLMITINDNDVRKVTSMCELAGVAPRYPLLDHSLAEFSGTVPADLKVRGTQLRYLFKNSMSGLLPQEIIEKTKHGFGLPYSVWVGDHKPLQDFTFDVLGSQACRQRNYFRPDLVPWLWSQYQNVHRNFYGSVLWLFLMLELWHLAAQDATSHDSTRPARSDPNFPRLLNTYAR